MSNRINHLLLILSDNQFHSGEALGDALGVSRAAVNQQISKLTELGLDIYSVHGKGYKLAQPVELLDADKISFHSGIPLVEFDVRSVVTSSNDIVRQQAQQRELVAGYAVIAEAQTAGRGRRGKPWFSPFGSNLYISLYWPLADGLNGAMGLSLVVGLAVAEVIESLGVNDVAVKWPNDVYVAGKKLSGVLVELDSRADGLTDCVIGVGINLSMPHKGTERIDQQWTDLQTQLVDAWSRNVVAGKIYRNIRERLVEFDTQGLRHTREQWPNYDIFYNKPVKLLMGQRIVTGVCRGIDENGAILIDNQDNVVRYFGGEISLRAND